MSDDIEPAITPTVRRNRTTPEKILSRRILDPETGCLLWLGGTTSNGYAKASLCGKQLLVHRLAWEQVHGPIPKAMQIDHLCRVRHCSEVSHLEVVTPRENLLRGVGPTAEHARKTHCPRGHLLAGENLDAYELQHGGRKCRTCKNVYRAARKKKVRLAAKIAALLPPEA